MAGLVVVAAVVCLLLSAMSLAGKVSRLRDDGYDFNSLTLYDAMRLCGWRAAGIWVSILALVLVLF